MSLVESMRYVKLIFWPAGLGVLAGLVLAVVISAPSSTDDIVNFSFGEVAPGLTLIGFVLGAGIGVVSSAVWAVWRWLARRHSHAHV